MDYREILRHQLRQRQEMNSKYSLRAFAKKIALSPSKVSEVLSGKKRLGAARAEEIAARLGLGPAEKELFVLSVRAESAAVGAERDELRKRLRELSAPLQARRTTQRNAWYFGAVQALEEAGHDPLSLKGLTALQIENARRFLRRVAKLYPDRRQLSFEPLSLLRKIEEQFYATPADAPVEADFLLLTPADHAELARKIRALVKTYKKSRSPSAVDLKMVYWGCLNLNQE